MLTNAEPVPIRVVETDPEVGTIQLNAAGALASGEAERIALILVNRNGTVNATQFAMIAYGEDGHGSHQAASSTLGHLVKKGKLARIKNGTYGLPKRTYKKRPPKPEARDKFEVGDVLEVVGFMDGKVVVRNMEIPAELMVVNG